MLQTLRQRAFYQKTLHILIPVVLQQLITIGVNFLDNIMVGSFGETSISAAAFSNQFYGLFQFICMGMGSGAIVMSSQFWGRKETGPMRTVSAIALRVTVVCCAVFTLLSVLAPAAILRVFTSDEAIVRAGTPYLRLLGVTFLPAGLSSTATYLLRSVGMVRVPLCSSIAAFFLNIFFNWVFIFGKLGAPALGLVGAAVGTVIARAVEFLIVFGYFLFKDPCFGFRLRHFLLPGASLRRQYIKFSVPVLVSDTLLGLSLSLTSVILGHIGGEITAASAIVQSAVQLISVLHMGMASASSVVIGNTIGEGALARARSEGASYVLLAFLSGLVLLVPLLLLEDAYVGLYTITEATRSITHGMVVCECCMLPIQAVAYVTSKGILRGGGDTRFLLFADSCMVWFVSLPLGALAGFVWHLAPVWIFFLLNVEFPLKGILCFIRFCTGRWVKVVRAGSGE